MNIRPTCHCEVILEAVSIGAAWRVNTENYWAQTCSTGDTGCGGRLGHLNFNASMLNRGPLLWPRRLVIGKISHKCRDSLLYKGSEDDDELGMEVTGWAWNKRTRTKTMMTATRMRVKGSMVAMRLRLVG
jgi:hypothetical protein